MAFFLRCDVEGCVSEHQVAHPQATGMIAGPRGHGLPEGWREVRMPCSEHESARYLKAARAVHPDFPGLEVARPLRRRRLRVERVVLVCPLHELPAFRPERDEDLEPAADEPLGGGFVEPIG